MAGQVYELNFDESLKIEETHIPDSPWYRDWREPANWTVDQNWLWGDAWIWSLNVNEKVKFAEKSVREITKSIDEELAIADARPRFEYSYVHYQNLGITDSVKNTLTFIRKFSETVRFVESVKKDVTKPVKEKFSIFDTMMRPAQGVISDLLFEEGSWTLDELDKYIRKGKHVGYEHFKPFINGDYNYEKALFRSVFDALSSDRAMLEQFKVTIDVPDLIDRGAAEISDKNADLKIQFTKNFHVAPEVTITMRSGSSLAPVVPEVVSVTEEQFTMRLLNALTGERTTGSFIWTAVGY